MGPGDPGLCCTLRNLDFILEQQKTMKAVRHRGDNNQSLVLSLSSCQIQNRVKRQKREMMTR